eukprot:TRINITY_DN8695_c0_g1_i3.p4 TRINITY_DN8695_c0_g1~~TRINITY_DN8695_c0_g1_i3.p4  ORF type:complete len:112 (-),score=26.24 TRINITY_DN8695_c0_g1_i3:25-360(-)
MFYPLHGRNTFSTAQLSLIDQNYQLLNATLENPTNAIWREENNDGINQGQVNFEEQQLQIINYDDEAANQGIQNQPQVLEQFNQQYQIYDCLLYTSPSPRDRQKSRMPSSA